MDAEDIMTALDVLWDRKHALLRMIAAQDPAPGDEAARDLVRQLGEVHLAIAAAGAALKEAKARGLHEGRYVGGPTDSDAEPTDNDG